MAAGGGLPLGGLQPRAVQISKQILYQGCHLDVEPNPAVPGGRTLFCVDPLTGTKHIWPLDLGGALDLARKLGKIAENGDQAVDSPGD